ncbi:Orn/Lys/Arg family decarboxylase [Cryptosporangium minutisporangium]|uniref:Orn/Lys/Arg decarboxylase C-terminal domain-containing protein n=1 Tax=Cryptosporangium minutisporangium TaxID=113569 RepID=A0ABP6T627_9ACTN
MICSLSYADDNDAVERLAAAFEALAADPPSPDRPAPAVPPLDELNLEQAMPPRDAFFAKTQQVKDPVGRISAEMISPYPPGVPAVLPGERFNAAVVEYLRGQGGGHDDPGRRRPRAGDVPGRPRVAPPRVTTVARTIW